MWVLQTCFPSLLWSFNVLQDIKRGTTTVYTGYNYMSHSSHLFLQWHPVCQITFSVQCSLRTWSSNMNVAKASGASSIYGWVHWSCEARLGCGWSCGLWWGRGRQKAAPPCGSASGGPSGGSAASQPGPACLLAPVHLAAAWSYWACPMTSHTCGEWWTSEKHMVQPMWSLF